MLRAIKGDLQTRAVPVVVLTSSYVQKPVNVDEFRRNIREIGVFWLTVNEQPPPEAFEGDS